MEQDLEVLRVNQELMAPQDFKEQMVLLVRQVQQEILVPQVNQDLKEPVVCQVPKVFREL